jgi:hypothetical protein
VSATTGALAVREDTVRAVSPVPAVTAAAAIDDRTWFADHPERRFRARVGNGGIWLIRRVPQGGAHDLFLRIFGVARRLPGDRDAELASAWYETAYPDWSAEKVLKWGQKALQKARRP